MNARHRRLLALGVVALAGGAIAQAPPGPAVQQAYIKAASPGVDDNFGTGVALSGETLLVGSPREDSGASGVNGDETDESLADSGAAYVFVRSGTSWSQQAYLKATTPAAGDRFGTAVALSGDTAVVGAPGALVGGVHGGAAWVFVRSGGVWAPQAVLTAAHPGAGDEFGAALAISGDTLVVSARFEDSAAVGIDGDETSEGAGNSGAAWVFVRSGTVWSQQAYVKASNAGAGDAFGFSLALDGDTLAVGANAEDSAATGVNGDQTSNAASGSGAAYVFVRSGASWSQQAYLKASNTGIADAFGVSVALGGETLAVGANFEDSASAGVNGDQTSNAQPGAGAAYVFVRSGTSWSQQAYVKASNPGPDTFGEAVGVSADTLVVGAPREDSKAAGVNGNGADNSHANSGAAYVFTRTGTAWTQMSYVKPGYNGSAVLIGTAVAAAPDTVVVGSFDDCTTSAGINGSQSAVDVALGGGSGAACVFDLDPGPWNDLSFGLAGAAGVPVLSGSGPLTPGSGNVLSLGGAKPSSLATLGVGTQMLSKNCKGGVFVPSPLLLVPLATDGVGAIALPFTWPSGVPAGTVLYLQFWISDAGAPVGLAASNALEAVAF